MCGLINIINNKLKIKIMKDCLVVRLKGVADNNDLPYFNCFTLDLKNETNTFSGKIAASANFTINDSDGGSTVITGNNLYQQISLQAGKTYYFMNPSVITLMNEFPVSYQKLVSFPETDYSLFTNVREIQMGGNIVGVPFDNHGITTILFQKAKMSLPKEDVLDWVLSQSSLNYFNDYIVQPYFTMYDLAKINVANLGGGVDGGGRVEDYVAMKRKLGNTTGTLTWRYITPGSTFDEVVIPDSDRTSSVLSWTATTITFGSKTINNDEVAP